MEEIQLLYQDSHILVCVKPKGMPSQPDPSGAPDLLTELQNKFGEVFLIHRLDRAVGGVMVFARTKNAAAKLSKQVAEHGNFRKIYTAVVLGKPEKTGQHLDLLYHDKRLHKAFVVKSKRNGVKEASLTYTTLSTTSYEGGEVSLLSVTLHTGRFHQIRVQFASRGNPLLGDGKYGSRIKCPLGLWATTLTFTHPAKNEELTFTAPPPAKEMPFSLFSI